MRKIKKSLLVFVLAISCGSNLLAANGNEPQILSESEMQKPVCFYSYVRDCFELFTLEIYCNTYWVRTCYDDGTPAAAAAMAHVTIGLGVLLPEVALKAGDKIKINQPIVVEAANNRRVEIPAGDYRVDGRHEIHLVAPVR